MKTKKLLGGIILLLSTLQYQSVSATDLALPDNEMSITDDDFGLSLEALMQVDVISSTLIAKDIRTVPSSVTVITRQQIVERGY